MNIIELGARPLTVADVVAVSRGRAPVQVASWSEIDASRAWLEGHIDRWRRGEVHEPIYGVTTGFGPAKNTVLAPEEIEAVQVNLLRSHASGVMADPEAFFDEEVVRAAALLRAANFVLGRSGVRREIVEGILALLKADVQPLVPCRGSVGASGDLCPLAHFALVLIGEGMATIPDGERRKRVSGAEALATARLTPLQLSYKEGLALLNGTAFSTAMLALALHDAANLARTADLACALGLEAIGGHARALDEKVHLARRQAGQIDSAQSMRQFTRSSRRLSTTDDKQDVYSYRCAPQVHGAARDALAHVRGIVEAELDGATDNPLIFASPGDTEPLDVQEFSANPRRFGRQPEDTRAYSAGNFHGQPIGLAADFLGMAITVLASISERRCAILLSASTSRGLPSLLVQRAGVNSGFMLLQYTAASLVSECKGLSHPASVDSIPTGNGAEDHVPMSTWAARKARTIVSLATRVIAAELILAAQANEWRSVFPDPTVAVGHQSIDAAEGDRRFGAVDPDAVAAELGQGTAVCYRAVRGLVPRLMEDRVLADDLQRISEAVHSGVFIDSVGSDSVPLRTSSFERPGD